MNQHAEYWWNNILTNSQRKWYVEVVYKEKNMPLERIAYEAWKIYNKGQQLRVIK